MTYFLDSIKKINSSKEAIDRIFFTFIVLLLYRFGSFVVLPGIDLALVEINSNARGAGSPRRETPTHCHGALVTHSQDLPSCD